MPLKDKIRNLRKKRNLTQADLGKLINKSSQVISNWERGYTSTINQDDIIKLAKILKVNVSELLDMQQEDSIIKSNVLNNTFEVEKIIDEAKNKLMTQRGLMFDGEPATYESIQSIIDAMAVGIELAKRRNKNKQTQQPKSQDE